MESSTTCRVAAMLARIDGGETYSESCRDTPTQRVLMRVEPVSGLRVEVLADLCHHHFTRTTTLAAFVRNWPIRDRSRPDAAATSLAAGS